MKYFFTGLSPNTTWRDALLACSWLVPFRWGKLWHGARVEHVELFLSKKYGMRHAIAFDSGRSALYLWLKESGISSGDEVILQAYTCIAVSNSIRWAGAVPKYVDITDNLTMDPADLRKKITGKTKAVIVQHTFGMRSDLDEIFKIANVVGIPVLEDSAHTLNGEYDARSSAVLVSFGSDKAVSAVRGGAVLTNDDRVAKKLTERKDHLPNMPFVMLLKHIAHPILLFFGKKTYGAGIGRILFFLSRIGLGARILEPSEKRGHKPQWMPARFPNALASLVFFQLQTLKSRNEHRQEIARIYADSIDGLVEFPRDILHAVPLRFPIFTQSPDECRAFLRSRGVMAGDWYDSPVAPKTVSPVDAAYEPLSCKRAESYAKRSVNLPTDLGISLADAAEIAHTLREYVHR